MADDNVRVSKVLIGSFQCKLSQKFIGRSYGFGNGWRKPELKWLTNRYITLSFLINKPEYIAAFNSSTEKGGSVLLVSQTGKHDTTRTTGLQTVNENNQAKN